VSARQVNSTVGTMFVLQCMCVCLLLQADLHYHTSAILSAAVDSMSVPYRRIDSPSLLTDLTDALSPVGRKVRVNGFWMLFMFVCVF